MFVCFRKRNGTSALMHSNGWQTDYMIELSSLSAGLHQAEPPPESSLIPHVPSSWHTCIENSGKIEDYLPRERQSKHANQKQRAQMTSLQRDKMTMKVPWLEYFPLKPGTSLLQNTAT